MAPQAAPSSPEFDQADYEIHRYARWAAGIGVVPALLPVSTFAPVLDIGAVTGVHLKMLKSLAESYGLEYSGYDRSTGRRIIGSLLGAALPARLGMGGLGAVMYSLPVIGSIAGIATMPLFNYAATVALGRVFQKHFASGGTLLDFDTDTVKGSFAAEVKKASEEAKAALTPSSSARRPSTA